MVEVVPRFHLRLILRHLEDQLTGSSRGFVSEEVLAREKSPYCNPYAAAKASPLRREGAAEGDESGP